jgi:hypothetical protein
VGGKEKCQEDDLHASVEMQDEIRVDFFWMLALRGEVSGGRSAWIE